MKVKFLGEILFVGILTILTIIYLKSEVDEVDINRMTLDTIDKVLKETSIYMDKEINYFQSYRNSFYNTLPLTQIIKYRKELFVNDLTLRNSNEELSESENLLLRKTKLLFSLEDILDSGRELNITYNCCQILGFFSVLFIYYLIYRLLIISKRQFLIKRCFIILCLLYSVNSIFYSLNSHLEKETRKGLQTVKLK